ncbi:MAG: cyclic dehypoxanthinyl futalosine synthase [Chloroflexota bacterium]|nr:cyclic dehypoxanthinyl futalosine synthase [Chloroflexota bacterium]
MLDRIAIKVQSREPINRQEGLFLLREVPLPALAPLAQIERYHHNPESVVTFAIDTNPNYTNVCDIRCAFCAFHCEADNPRAYTHTVEEMMAKVEQSVNSGVTTILLQGGLNPNLPLDYYIDLVRTTRQRFPNVHPHYFSAPEIQKMSQVSGLSITKVLGRLKEVGLNTIPGGGAEVLSDRVKQKISPRFPKRNSTDWLDVHREAHRLGYRTTATMMYGHVDNDEDILEHLDQIRALQEETAGFTAFIPWSYKREHNALGKKIKEEAGPNRYLRIIAVARIFLNNFPHIQASWFSEGKKTGQIALYFGGDDFGGTIMEEDVMQCAGFHSRTTVDEVVGLIQQAGFVPAQRTTLYEIIRYFNPTMSNGGTTDITSRSAAS